MTTLTRVNKNKPTDKQCELLRKLGHTGPLDRLDKGMASALIERLKQNPENHRPTDKQATLLQQLGYAGNIDELSATSASATIDGLINALKQARESIKASTDLRELAGRYTELRGGKEQEGPCPKCGGDNRFHCKADFWFCRQCYDITNGLPHDAVAFVMWHDNVTEAQAIANLTGGVLVAPAGQATRQAPAPKQREPQTDDWLHGAKLKVDYAHRRLMDDTDMQAGEGRHYLDSRGIEPHTWIAFKFGYTSDASLPGTEGKQKAPAIVIPWYKGGKLVAVRYRFLKLHKYTDIEGKERNEKQTALKDSSFTGAIYGGQALSKRVLKLTTLIVCEGELNGGSIWQTVYNQNVHVFSLGSESAVITPAFAEHAKNYASVLVWMDKEERSQAIAAALVDRNDKAAYPIKSPPKKDATGQVIVDDKGKPASLDANDFLKSGKLGGFLALHRWQAATNQEAQEAALWDVYDAAQLPMGADDYTLSMLAYIAKTMGVTLEKERVTPDKFQFNTNTPAHTERPPLPPELWRYGIASQAEALQIHSNLHRDYTAELGQNADGYYIDSTIERGE